MANATFTTRWPVQVRSSPARGAVPPLRRRKRSALALSPRVARFWKYSAVLIADTFSATALTMNWLRVLPTSRATTSAVFLSEAGRRSA